MDDCIFCKIINREVPSTIVYEDDDVLAFEDLNPQMPVHTLIVPKVHYDHIGDDVPQELLGKLFLAVPKVAKIKGVDESGYRTIINTGDDARQTVHHMHIHVLGGERMPIHMGPLD
jgi:histidine triad (HIT) family protein